MKKEKKYIKICRDQKIKDITNKILDLFKTGNIPESIALLTNPKINIPSNSWSLRNRLIALAYGTIDARGFNVWQSSNRRINKGSKAFNILAPLIIKEEKEGAPEKNKLIGFRPVPVFRVEDTNGETLDYEKIEVPNFKFIDVADFGGVGVINMLSAVVTAIPPFFSIMLFVIWIFGTAASYFSILKLTGKKRFWHSLTAFSFSMFIASLLLVAQNTTEVEFLSGYWVGFYILMTIMSWVLLDRYK
jgi:hypothetical protein